MRCPSRQYPDGADGKVLPAIVDPCGKDAFENIDVLIRAEMYVQ
jgi:hypothetical protein